MWAHRTILALLWCSLIGAQYVVLWDALATDALGVASLTMGPWTEGSAGPGRRTTVLDEPDAVERFLESIDGAPPDWSSIYGRDGVGHDERLFELNRERDAGRAQRRLPVERLTFFWTGELSDFDPDRGGFRVAVGPQVIPTQWGLVRFKPDNLPGYLVAIPSDHMQEALRAEIAAGHTLAVQVAFTGTLIPEESIVYDFAHEKSGTGMVMPVIRVDRIQYVLTQ